MIIIIMLDTVTQLGLAANQEIDLYAWRLRANNARAFEYSPLATTVPVAPNYPPPTFEPHKCHGETERYMMSPEEAAGRIALFQQSSEHL